MATSKGDSPPSIEEKAEAKANGSQTHEISGSKNEWKFRAPYKIHSSSDSTTFKTLYHGSCHCGRIEFQLSREKPLASKYCHCTTCQVLHGAPFQWACVFEKEDVNFTKGHHELVWYDSGEKTTEHILPCKVKCGYCGTPVMDEGRKMILMFPTLLKWKSEKEREKFAPTCHMFYGQRVVDIKDGLEKWSGLQGKSELIEDSSAEAVKKRKRDVEEEEREEREKKRKKHPDHL